jgi:hypothetical protein
MQVDIQDQLQTEAAALRQAVIREDFAGVRVSARRYVEALEIKLKPLSSDDANVLFRNAVELLEWARRSVCASRGRLAVQLRNVQRMALYRPAPRRLPSRFRFDA